MLDRFHHARGETGERSRHTAVVNYLLTENAPAARHRQLRHHDDARYERDHRPAQLRRLDQGGPPDPTDAAPSARHRLAQHQGAGCGETPPGHRRDQELCLMVCRIQPT
jgi:hypothetical protein